MSFSPEQSKAIKDSIASAEKSIAEHELDLARVIKAGIPAEALKLDLQQKKDALAKIKAVFG